ncbi:MAG: hypothetical protein HC797_05185 [Anaerolineales bacterium]|nr:hypothetical protein [Anaerolineales bacterium]
MNSVGEHNAELQREGMFSSSDFEENKKGKYSQIQIKRFEDEREFIRSSVGKYENKNPIISLVFGFSLLVFAGILYFVGVFDILQDILGGLFFPIMVGVAILAALFIFVIIPRQYQSSVEMYKGLGTPLEESSLSQIQVVEARAETYKSQGGINRRGHQSSKISNVLKMGTIEFNLTDSFFEAIQPKRLYRVYAVKNQVVWVLLSMETLE